MVSALWLALAACSGGGTGAKIPKDGGQDHADTGAAGTAGDDAGTAGTGGAVAGASGGEAGAAAGAGDGGAAGADGGTAGSGDGGVTEGGGADGAAGATVNTCGTADGGATDGGVGLCAAGKAECGGAAGDCETSIATDVMNCGRCGRACGAGATCTNGLCGGTVILKPDVSSNWCGAAFTATKAYMITCWGTSLSEVRVAPLEPGASVIGTSIKAYTGVSVVALRGIVVDGDSVTYGLEASPSNLWKFPLDATGPTDVVSASTFENGTRFDSLQLVGDTYWWNHNTHTVAGQIAPSTIKKRAKTGATSSTVVSLPGVSSGLVVTATHLYWIETRTGVGSGIYTAPIAGGTVDVTKKLSDATGGYLVRQGDYVYWTQKVAAPNGKVLRLKIDDDAATPEPVSTCLESPTGLAADASYVYFRQADSLYRAPVAGGPAERLSVTIPAHPQQATQIFHVDDKYVYFAADPGFGTSSLVRVAK